MVSAATRNQVWNQLIDVWHYARYFNDLSEKKTKANRYRLILHGLVAAGVSATLLGFLPSVVALVGNVIVVVFSVYSLVHDHSQELARVRAISDRCDLIKTDSRALWLDVENYAIETDEATMRWRQLEQEIDNIMVQAPPTNADLSKAAEVSAIKIVEEETRYEQRGT